MLVYSSILKLWFGWVQNSTDFIFLGGQDLVDWRTHHTTEDSAEPQLREIFFLIGVLCGSVVFHHPGGTGVRVQVCLELNCCTTGNTPSEIITTTEERCVVLVRPHSDTTRRSLRADCCDLPRAASC